MQNIFVEICQKLVRKESVGIDKDQVENEDDMREREIWKMMTGGKREIANFVPISNITSESKKKKVKKRKRKKKRLPISSIRSKSAATTAGRKD